MSVTIQRFDRRTGEMTELGRVQGGDVVDGEGELSDLDIDPEADDSDLLDRFDGPTLFAVRDDTAEAAEGRPSPFADVDPIPDDTTRLEKDDLALWLKWVREGRPETPAEFSLNPDPDAADASVKARKFNPSLHPRGPDGKFVERPWDIPDSLDLDGIRATPTADILDELDKAGEDIDAVLQDDDIRIDGIPDEADSVDEAKALMGGDGLAFQDLEPNDEVTMVDPSTDLGTVQSGTVLNTEQVDGGPNIVHLADDSGAVTQVPAPDGTRIERANQPFVPPTEVDGDDQLTGDDISVGDRVAVTTGWDMGGPTYEGAGTVEDKQEMSLGGKTGITVNGDQYDPDHPNIGVFDAEPDEITFDSLSEGDPVTVFAASSGNELVTGEVVDAFEAGDNRYVEVAHADKPSTTQVNFDTHEFAPPGTLPADATDDDVQEAIEDANADSDFAPSAIDPDDVPADIQTDTSWDDVDDGDWVVYKEPNGDAFSGVVTDSESVITDVDTGDGIQPLTSTTAPIVRTFDPNDLGADSDVPPLSEASPGDITPDDLTDDNLMDLSPPQVEPGMWVQYSADGGPEKVAKVDDINNTGNVALFNDGEAIKDVPVHGLDSLDQVISTPTDDAMPDIDTSDIDPSTVTIDDVDPDDIVDVDADGWTDLEKGDFVLYDGPNTFDVGRLQESPDSEVSLTDIDFSGGQGVTPKTFKDANTMAHVPDDVVASVGDESPTLSFSSPEADDIDPDTVSADAIPFEDQTTGYDFAASQEGDWVTFVGSDDERHAGQVSQPGPSEIQIRTGHHSDPQVVAKEGSGVRGIDSEAVVEAGSKPGSSTTKTGVPSDHTEYDLPDVDDFTSQPNPPENISPSDLKHPVSPPDEDGFGMLSGQHADALVDAAGSMDFGGTSILTPSTEQNTGNRPGELTMSYPQADGKAVREQVVQFVQEVSGVPSGGAKSEMKTLLDNIHEWKGTSYDDGPQAVEKAFHAGLRLPGPLRNHGLDGENASPTKAAIAAALSKVSQEFIRENFDAIDQVERFGVDSDDDELPLYRGVASPAVGSLLRDWAEDPEADEISVQSSKLGNYTTDPSISDHWATKNVVFKQNAKVEDVVMSPDITTSGETGIDDEAEIWLTGGLENAEPSNIQIRSRANTDDGEPLTMADLPSDPADLDEAHLDIIHAFADRMWSKAADPGNDPSKYLLNSQSQVDTLQEVLDEMEAQDYPHHMRSAVEDFVSDSVGFIQDQDEGGTGVTA